MIATSRFNDRTLSTWDATKQTQYRAQHPQEALTFHFLLDASPSMIGKNATALRTAYNMYLQWLQRHAHPMSQAEVRCFSTVLDTGAIQPLSALRPLTGQTYNPLEDDGTALYRAVGDTCTTAPATGQHLLVVFTDGLDNTSAQFDWTSSKVFMLLKTLQEVNDWCCVFLGAFPEALEVGKDMGFLSGNCLTFASDRIPEAFQSLQRATQKYIAASTQERKLLAAGSMF